MTPPESLTDEERSSVERAIFRLDTDDFTEEREAIAKLLRVHDRLQGEVRELEALVANEASWRGGYEMTGEAGEQLFRLLGLEPRCLPPLD